MARYTLTIPESKTEQVLAYLKSLRGVKVEEAVDQQEDDIVIHDWQKKILDERLKEIQENPDCLVDWKIVQKKIERKYGF
ncbi:MAG: addiction module protein [Flavobacteriales bacterium]|nr:addiction module protein [Flavobacteriales bacterium]